jgi:hypothetical protein
MLEYLINFDVVPIAVLSMQTARESREDIRDTLTALDTEVDIGDVYLGLGPGNRYCLASMVYFMSYACMHACVIVLTSFECFRHPFILN